MDKILSINTIKNVFSALGAKTSDDNYGVALLDKTSGEPKGLMGIGDLASVLGVAAVEEHITDFNFASFGKLVFINETSISNAPSTGESSFTGYYIGYFNVGTGCAYQLYTECKNNTQWHRTRMLNGNWTSWAS